MFSRQRIGDVDLAFDDQGGGPAVLMLPPFPFDGRIWADGAQALVDAGQRAITIDYPGFGDSRPPPTPVSIQDLATLLAGVMDRLEIETAALVGLSMGGYVALAFAHLFPRRLRALVLADTRAAPDSPAARQGRAEALRTIREDGVEAYLRQSIPRLLSPQPHGEVLARALSLAERRQETLEAGIAALRDRPDRSHTLPTIRCPTLVLVGAADGVSPPAEMQRMADSVPGARFLEIPGAGHLANLEAPQSFNQSLTGFLAAAEDAATTNDYTAARTS